MENDSKKNKKKLAVFYNEKCLLHKGPASHPEKPERVKTIIDYLQKENFWQKTDIISPGLAEEKNIISVHKKEYFDHVKKSLEEGKNFLDPDTYIVKASLEVSLLAAGAAVEAIDKLFNNEYKYIFSLMRPPGHHAETNRAMGFCLFNNAALAAQYAIDKYGLERIAVIDWDVHHGNGTQEIFYERSDVFYISTHQHPLYPGTGMKNDTGEGSGKGFTKNFPLPPGTDGLTFIEIFQNEIIKILNVYSPQLLIISAGFDAHKDDPLASLKLTENDFKDLTVILKDFADEKNIPVLSVLEGGYNLNALAKSVYEHLKILND